MSQMGDDFRAMRKHRQAFRRDLPYCPVCAMTKLLPHNGGTEWWCKYCKDTHPMSESEISKYSKRGN